MQVWLAQEPLEPVILTPESRPGRIVMQSRPFDRHDFPQGPRGDDWAQRTVEVDEETFRATLAGGMDDAEVDRFHQDAWAAAEGEDGP